ncbi:MAG TPA: histidine phosphatase family protein [Anaerolineales bacterium]|nr:histidine phosphatase family protein [Anaerolineales bacterium]
MKKFLILVKHSLPEVIESLPAREWRLSEQGRVLAERLAKRLTRFKPEIVVSSSEPKARETAEIIAEINQLELHLAEELHEHDRSNVPYLSQAEFEALIREFFQQPEILVFGKETADQAYVRFSQAMSPLLRFHSNETIVAVAHGTVISLFVSRLKGISGPLLWKELGLPSFLVIDRQSNALIARESNI